MRDSPGEKGEETEVASNLLEVIARDLWTREKVRDPNWTKDVDGPTESLNRQSAFDKVLCANPDHFPRASSSPTEQKQQQQRQQTTKRTRRKKE